MRVGYFVRRALSMPPQMVVRKAAGKIRRTWQAWAQYRHDIRHGTYHTSVRLEPFAVHSYLGGIRLDPGTLDRARLAWLSRHYLNHRFNLLGSGWTQVRRGMSCPGMDGHRYDLGGSEPDGERACGPVGCVNEANREEAARIWSLIDPEYRPLDWQLDFKSGYRWSERTWYRRVPLVHFGHLPGVDVKVPWELARMQHLPQLALAYGCARSGAEGFMPPQSYLSEFRNEVLDFMATNPPRFGVNWTCAMDVGIRAANWLIGHDLFAAFGGTFDQGFEALFARSLYEHGTHIIGHLEWDPDSAGNHYLADVVGLLYIAAYLPSTDETDAWLAFAVQELVKEVDHQFMADGANFEASTSYHGLCAELVAYGTALVLGLGPEKRSALRSYDARAHRVQPELGPPPIPVYPHPEGEATPFPPSYWERLGRMSAFVSGITRPDGRIPQIGDRDNGRFVKLVPALVPRNHEREGAAVDAGSDLDWCEDHGDLRHVCAELAALVEPVSDADRLAHPAVDHEVVSRLARRNPWPLERSLTEAGPAADTGLDDSAGMRDLRQGLQRFAYAAFGLYVYKSPRLYLAIRCGRGDQNNVGNHAHNDNLSFEMAVDGRAVVVDPGTYVYTASIDQRNRYRSTRMHNTLVVNGLEQNVWQPGREGLFLLRDRTRARVEAFGEERFLGTQEGFGVPHRREVSIAGDAVLGEDECVAEGAKQVCFHLAPGVTATIDGRTARLQCPDAGPMLALCSAAGDLTAEEYGYSAGYGHRVPAEALIICTTEARVAWKIQVVNG